jgi:hypothetical protein
LNSDVDGTVYSSTRTLVTFFAVRPRESVTVVTMSRIPLVVTTGDVQLKPVWV